MNERKKSRLQIRIDKELHKAVRYKAVDLETTITRIVEEALREWLQRHKENTIEVE